jgi:Tol biopolymer transport system component
MNDVRVPDRLVTDWLRAEAPMRAPEGSLDVVLRRVAETGQQPHLTQRIFGPRLGRSRQLRLALSIAVLVLVLVAAALVAGSLRLTAPDLTSGADGLVLITRQGGPIGSTAATEIWMLRSDGTMVAALPPDPAIDRDCPAMSPDGRQVVFVDTTDAARTNLVVAWIQPSGELVERMRVAVAPVAAWCPQWSPTSRLVAFGSETGDMLLWDLDARTARTIRQAGADERAVAIAWAPEGRSIAVSTGRRIDIVEVETGRATTLIEGRGGQGQDTGIEEFDGLSWSRDGKALAVWGENNVDQPGGSFVRIVQVDGSAQANLPVRGPVTLPLWSPVDDRLAFLENRADIVIYRNSGLPGQAAQNVRLPRLDEAFNGSRAGIGTFVWTQDGERIVFSVFRVVESLGDDEGAVAVLSADGSADPVLIVPWNADSFMPAGAQAGPR